jgi:SNF2 family DNA or RNA helicase
MIKLMGVPVVITDNAGRRTIAFRYNPKLLAEIKAMEEAKWHPETKTWTVKLSERNIIAFDYLIGKNPFSIYDTPLREDVTTSRTLFSHQLYIKKFTLTYKRVIIAAEMGTGKTLSVIEVMEDSGITDWYYVAPKSAIKSSIPLEFKKWKSKVYPTFLTYEGLKNELIRWQNGKKPPRGIIFDESQRIKNWSAQRTQAAYHLASAMRKEHSDYYIIEMTGTPAPKSPEDWWSQVEIVAPGLLREGTPTKFKNRLSLIKMEEGDYGSYPKLVTWWDNPEKCKKCGKLKEEHALDMTSSTNCIFEPSIDEVGKLHRRLKGVVLTLFKKDCLDLPEKQYKIIRCTPTPKIIAMAQVIAESSATAIEALTNIRLLSDGINYENTVSETETSKCPLCEGSGQIDDITNHGTMIVCTLCGGTGIVKKKIRNTHEMTCPKDEVLIDLLDEFSDDPYRVIVFSGFEGTVDKVVKICHKNGWETLRVDGRGYIYTDINGLIVPMNEMQMIERFQDKAIDCNIAFVGNSEAAGISLTLTASPVEIYYSNSFKAEARRQSEDRAHRPGMDKNRGLLIIDIFHMPTDEYVYTNITNKMELEKYSLTGIKECLNHENSN